VERSEAATFKKFPLTLLSILLATACSSRSGGADVAPQAPSAGWSGAISEYSVLYAFQGGSDGAHPQAALTKLNGELYGTTSQGGGAMQCPDPSIQFTASGCGTVFRIDQSSDVGVLYRFAGTDGANPDTNLVASNGLLIGTTRTSNSSCPLSVPSSSSSSSHTAQLGSCGTIFSLTPSGQWTLLFNFQNDSGQLGAYPNGITVVRKAIFGTTTNGGTGGECASYYQGELQYPTFNGCGLAFSLGKTETTLHNFGSGKDASIPASRLTPLGGNLYGTSVYGGSGKCQVYPPYYNYSTSGCGTVYVLSPSGSENVVYKFGGDEDGKWPYSGLTVHDGLLYGTTSSGGRKGDCCGTVFEVTPSGAERVVYAFKAVPDGVSPRAALVFVHGKFYGTTMLGGSARCDCGTIFSVTRSGHERVVHSFAGNQDGAYPESSLTYFQGRLYGTTEAGGSKACAHGCGTVFAFTP